jgi:hypothetical protein
MDSKQQLSVMTKPAYSSSIAAIRVQFMMHGLGESWEYTNIHNDICEGMSFYSAYPLTETTIVPYKHSSAHLSPDKRTFNHRLSGLHVSVEHCIGHLKARFPSLRELLPRIRRKGDVALCMKWIGSCVVLYNLLLDPDDDIEPRWEMPNDDGSHEDEEEIAERDVGRESEGKKKRNAMMREVVAEERDYH